MEENITNLQHCVAEPKLFIFGSGSTFVPYILAPAPAIYFHLNCSTVQYKYSRVGTGPVPTLPVEVEISFSSS